MNNISGRNVNVVLANACWLLATSGIKEETRVGPVVSSPRPVMVEYLRPRERVLLWPERKANPFFHFFEALWMLAGRRDLAYLEQFNGRMREFSDDGKVFHGAYGYRWRQHFSLDQLTALIKMLTVDPLTRRAVLTMWEPDYDLSSPSKDIPCNTHIYFRVVKDRLTMTVCNRSNDLVWGLCGANVVHFSVLHEFVAHATGNLMGSYYHFTNNLHIYDSVPKRDIYSRPFIDDKYAVSSARGGVEAMPMCTVRWENWLLDCQAFVEASEPENGKYHDQWFNAVAVPMWLAWRDHSAAPLKSCIAEDWRAAGELYFAGLS
jgi:hypothetical protein